jgi:hypothetical protein
MKILRWIGWISLGLAGVIIILACIMLATDFCFLGFNHAVNYFTAANSFLLLAIALFIVTKHCCCCDDKCDKKES